MKSPFRKKVENRYDRKKVQETMDSFSKIALDISEKNPDALIILGDPKSDAIFMAHRGVCAPISIINKDGTRNAIVANALRHGKENADIDRFLLAVDGGLFAIADKLYNEHRSLKNKAVDWFNGGIKPVESKVKLTDGSTLSPIQVVE